MQSLPAIAASLRELRARVIRGEATGQAERSDLDITDAQRDLQAAGQKIHAEATRIQLAFAHSDEFPVSLAESFGEAGERLSVAVSALLASDSKSVSGSDFHMCKVLRVQLRSQCADLLADMAALVDTFSCGKQSKESGEKSLESNASAVATGRVWEACKYFEELRIGNGAALRKFATTAILPLIKDAVAELQDMVEDKASGKNDAESSTAHGGSTSTSLLASTGDSSSGFFGDAGFSDAAARMVPHVVEVCKCGFMVIKQAVDATRAVDRANSDGIMLCSAEDCASVDAVREIAVKVQEQVDDVAASLYEMDEFDDDDNDDGADENAGNNDSTTNKDNVETRKILRELVTTIEEGARVAKQLVSACNLASDSELGKALAGVNMLVDTTLSRLQTVSALVLGVTEEATPIIGAATRAYRSELARAFSVGVCAPLQIPKAIEERWASRLLAAYGDEPQRAYHTLEHIRELLDHLAALPDRDPNVPVEGGMVNVHGIVDRAAVALAIWLHDAVYDPKASAGSNEAESAQWFRELAEEVLAAVTDPSLRHRWETLAPRVHQWIIDTWKHVPSDREDGDLLLFLDMDCAILGQPEDRYKQYAGEIRFEYQHVPEPAFRNGRAAVLDSLIEGGLFNTALFRDRYDSAARRNMSEEKARLLDTSIPIAIEHPRASI